MPRPVAYYVPPREPLAGLGTGRTSLCVLGLLWSIRFKTSSPRRMSASVGTSSISSFLGAFAIMTPAEEQLAFYYEVGRSITQWAHVEFALASMIAGGPDQVHGHMLVAGLFSIENFRSKLQYVDTMMSARALGPQDAETWRALRERCGTRSAMRNTLAHSWVLTDPDGKPGRRCKLMPMSSTGKERQPICLRDVAKLRSEFFALTTAIDNFSCRVRGLAEPFPEHLEQPQRPPTLAAIRREIHAAAGPPPRPLRA